MRRAVTQLVFLAMTLAASACQDKPDESEPQSCFLKLIREAPGRLRLEKPVACTHRVARYRLESLGAKDRPERVDYLDPDGVSRLRYRVRYDQQGRPVAEERLYLLEPTAYKLYGGRTQLEFSDRAEGKLESIRILTDLDSSGRPVKIRKFTGSNLEYSVVSEYRGERLHSKTTYDGQKRLKNKIEYHEKQGRRFERMLGPDGKVLMEREVAEKDAHPEQALDTSGHRPVHSPVPSN